MLFERIVCIVQHKIYKQCENHKLLMHRMVVSKKVLLPNTTKRKINNNFELINFYLPLNYRYRKLAWKNSNSHNALIIKI